MTIKEIAKEIEDWDAVIQEADKRIAELRTHLEIAVQAQNERREHVRQLVQKMKEIVKDGANA